MAAKQIENNQKDIDDFVDIKQSWRLFWWFLEIGNGKEGTDELKEKYRESGSDSTVHKAVQASFNSFRAAELKARDICPTNRFVDQLDMIAEFMKAEINGSTSSTRSTGDVQASKTADETSPK